MTTVAVCVPTIPTRAVLLERALASVSGQTRRPESVCVATDDGANGAAPTRNQAWRYADTEWVAFLDDDDEFRPQHLERLLGCAEDERADLVYPWFDIVDNMGKLMSDRDPLRIEVAGQLLSPFGLPFGERQIVELRTRNNFIPVTVLVRRSLLKEVDGFPTPGTPEWPESCCEDWGLWRRLLDAGATFAHLPERTWLWRWHGANTSGKPWKRTRRK